MSGEEDAALRGETAKLIKELGLADFNFDDADADEDKPQKKSNNKKKEANKEVAAKKEAPAKIVPAKAAPAKAAAANGLLDKDAPKPKGDKKAKPAESTKKTAHTTAPAVAKAAKSPVQHKQQKAQPTAQKNNSAKGSGVSQALPTWLAFKGKGKGVDFVQSEEGHWYDTLSALPQGAPSTRVDATMLARIGDQVQDKFEEEVTRYQEKRTTANDADSKWLRDVIQSGTLSDRVAALAMQVQKSPVHHLRALDTMIDMCCKKEQRVAQLAIEATKDLLQHNLLPDRPLVPFLSRSFYGPEMNLNRAVLCWFEGELIHRVARFVGALEAGTMVHADYFKKICLDVSVDMLVAKPEQEARHLALIVNKLGDPSSPICTKAMESLKRVVHAHPAMSPVVIREIRNFISRPHLAVRALFSSILFLSQIPIKGDSIVAAQLVECYVSLFEKAVQREESGSRLLYALLTGINRAFPFLRDREPILRHLDALFRIVHSAAFTTSTQALMLISHIALVDEKGGKKVKDDSSKSESEQLLINRFYRALYDKLLSNELSTRARNTLFLNLLFRSMKRDPSAERITAFVKRLMICVTQCSSNIAAGFIFLIAEVFRHRPEVLKMITEVEKISEKPLSGAEEIHAFGNFNVEKREPMYAVPTDCTPVLWEAALLRQHFHPSVKAFANSWLSPPNHTVKFDGDPITEFSISAFLNRFSYKNPKTRNMEKVHRPLPKAEDPVNSEMFVGADADSVSPDKAFFHKYFGARIRLLGEGKIKDRSRHKADDDEDEDEEGSGDEGEKAAKAPKVQKDDEAEIDEYADELAEELMRSAAGNQFNKADIDDDLDFSSDGDDNSDDEDAGDGDMEEDEEEYGDMPRDPEDSDGEDESGEEMDFQDFSDEDFSEDGDDIEVRGRGKKRKNDDDVFASAEDYEYDMEEIMQLVESHGASAASISTADRKNDSLNKKQKTGKQATVDVVEAAGSGKKSKKGKKK